jgi:NAD(P)-dependent dehydrogenase (short-subunit alcohol dehydrogenase family)
MAGDGRKAGGERLAGRRILVTGAGSGIGRATAVLFAREGATLSLLDQNAAAAGDAAAETGGKSFQVDVSEEAQVTEAIAAAAHAMGGIDGVVNCAGIMSSDSFADTAPKAWRRMLDVNLTGPYLICHAALPWLQQAPGSTIVNIASGQALLPAVRGCSYTAAKAGLMMFTKALAAELAPGIRANVICPGASDTPMTESVIPSADKAGRAAFVQRYALKRLSEPEEVANAILFLTGLESSAITGVALAVDCGRTFH